jgi:hypothetical protein
MAPQQSSSNRPLSMEAILVEEDGYQKDIVLATAAKEGPGCCSSNYHLLLFLASVLTFIAAIVAIIVLIRSNDDGTSKNFLWSMIRPLLKIAQPLPMDSN